MLSFAMEVLWLVQHFQRSVYEVVGLLSNASSHAAISEEFCSWR